MAQWQVLLSLDSASQSLVSQLYEGRFPREMRHRLSSMIESLDWDSAAVDENTAKACLHSLLLHLTEHRDRSITFLQGPDYTWMMTYLHEQFDSQPLRLASILSECLREEKKILASLSEAPGCSSTTETQNWIRVDNKVHELTRQTMEVKKGIQWLEDLDERPTQGLLQQLVDLLNLAVDIVGTLIDVELPAWKHRQQMACIGSPVDTSLDHLQKWFTAVAQLLMGAGEQMLRLQKLNQNYDRSSASSLAGPIADIQKFQVSLLTKLLTNALVVQKQPSMARLPHRPLILKTMGKFSVTVRFLANLPEFKCLFKVNPVFDKDVEELHRIKGFRLFNFCKDACKVLDADSPDGGLVAEFSDMQLKETEARVKVSSEIRLGVTEELHIIKFVMELQYAGVKLNIEVSSLPLVVISATSQVASAWASVMWSNMLSTSEPRNLSLFVEPPPLPWQKLSQLLNWQFSCVGQRELDANQLSMLRDKFVDHPDDITDHPDDITDHPDDVTDHPDDVVHWSKFSTNNGVWVWIDGILDLIQKHLLDLWKEGFIMGFVSREQTWALLNEKQTGNFLIRFSESNKEGAISFSWVEHSNGKTHVHPVQPYTKKELSVMNLTDIINHYGLKEVGGPARNPLLYLYPDIPKESVFGRCLNPSVKSADGYVIRPHMLTSRDPTPPPSPPDTDMEDSTKATLVSPSETKRRLLEELVNDILDLRELPQLCLSPADMS